MDLVKGSKYNAAVDELRDVEYPMLKGRAPESSHPQLKC